MNDARDMAWQLVSSVIEPNDPADASDIDEYVVVRLSTGVLMQFGDYFARCTFLSDSETVHLMIKSDETHQSQLVANRGQAGPAPCLDMVDITIPNIPIGAVQLCAQTASLAVESWLRLYGWPTDDSFCTVLNQSVQPAQI